MSIEVEDIEGAPQKPDFRRANGAPMITDKDGKNQRFSRPSGWGKELDDENALVNWKIDTALRGSVNDKSVQAKIAAVKDDDRKGKASVREAAIQAGRGNQAADIGTALHAMSERWEDADDKFMPPEPYKTALTAYTAELARTGLVSELFEYTVVNVEYRAAGTCDRLYRLSRDLTTPKGDILPAGTLCIGDLKTGKSLDFSLPGYHVQMAIYAQGEMYDVETDKFMPTPEINQDWGFLVHMPASGDHAGECEILWCDLEVGNYGAYLVHEVRDWRRKWKNSTYGSPIVDTPGVAELGMIADALEDAVEMLDREMGAEPLDYPEFMRPFVKSRVAAIRDDKDASADLVMMWPEGCPSPAQYTTDEQAEMILDLLDKIEAKYGLTFPGDDPRGMPNGHHSSYSVTNKAPGVVQKEVVQ